MPGYITARRLRVWEAYHEAFSDLESRCGVRRPTVPEACRHNGHLYYLLLGSETERDAFIAAMAERGVQTVFHYVPLHRAPAAAMLARACGTLDVTERQSGRLVRLPVWPGMSQAEIDHVVDAVRDAVRDVVGKLRSA